MIKRLTHGRRLWAESAVVLDSGGHLFVGRQQEVNGAIADFVERLAAAERNVRPFRLRA